MKRFLYIIKLISVFIDKIFPQILPWLIPILFLSYLWKIGIEELHLIATTTPLMNVLLQAKVILKYFIATTFVIFLINHLTVRIWELYKQKNFKITYIRSSNSTVKQENGKKKMQMIILIATLLFIVIQLPFSSKTFSAKHHMKYASYIQPALEMVDNGYLWNQKKYRANILEQESGVFHSFGTYPVVEWSLATLYKLTPGTEIEVTTRIFTLSMGVIALVLLLKFLGNFLPIKSFIFTALFLAINPILHLNSFITVYDIINLITFFLALNLLYVACLRKSFNLFFLAGIITGFGISLKYAEALYTLPFVFLFIPLFYKASKEKVLTALSLFLIPCLIETVVFRLSFKYLPEDPVKYGLLFLFFVILHIITLLIIKRIAIILEGFYAKLSTVAISILFSSLSVLVSIFVTQTGWVEKIAGDFLTDIHLLFNLPMYMYIARIITGFVTSEMLYIAVIGLTLILIKKSFSSYEKILLLFIIGTAVYLVIASKAIFFHDYYTHIISITISLLFAYTLFELPRHLDGKNSKRIILTSLYVLAITTTFHSIYKTLEYMSLEDKDAVEVGYYLKENMSNKEYFVGDDNYAMSTYARKNVLSRYSLYPGTSIGQTFLSYLENHTFEELGKKFNLKYFVVRSTPDLIGYNGFMNILSASFEANDSTVASTRTQRILCKVNSICPARPNTYYVNWTKFLNHVRPHLHLEKEIGLYQIFSFY